MPKLLSALLIITFLICQTGPSASAQYRRLPKASFPSYARGGESEPLPSISGVHLSPQQSRPRGPSSAEHYDPGEPSLGGALCRWDQRKMPIHVWISPGLKLPEATLEEATQTRVDLVYSMLRQGDPFLGIETAPGWTPEMNYVVASGIEQWREFQNEGLISFDFVDDPRQAHVLVFFTESFKDANMGGIAVGGNTVAQVFKPEQQQLPNYVQKPTIIELCTYVNHEPRKMKAAAAHEFGHALGIKAHSEYREDIMFVDRVVEELSPADKATLRYLYRSVPQYLF